MWHFLFVFSMFVPPHKKRGERTSPEGEDKKEPCLGNMDNQLEQSEQSENLYNVTSNFEANRQCETTQANEIDSESVCLSVENKNESVHLLPNVQDGRTQPMEVYSDFKSCEESDNKTPNILRAEQSPHESSHSSLPRVRNQTFKEKEASKVTEIEDNNECYQSQSRVEQSLRENSHLSLTGVENQTFKEEEDSNVKGIEDANDCDQSQSTLVKQNETQVIFVNEKESLSQSSVKHDEELPSPNKSDMHEHLLNDVLDEFNAIASDNRNEESPMMLSGVESSNTAASCIDKENDNTEEASQNIPTSYVISQTSLDDIISKEENITNEAQQEETLTTVSPVSATASRNEKEIIPESEVSKDISLSVPGDAIEFVQNKSYSHDNDVRSDSISSISHQSFCVEQSANISPKISKDELLDVSIERDSINLHNLEDDKSPQLLSPSEASLRSINTDNVDEFVQDLSAESVSDIHKTQLPGTSDFLLRSSNMAGQRSFKFTRELSLSSAEVESTPHQKARIYSILLGYPRLHLLQNKNLFSVVNFKQIIKQGRFSQFFAF
ncbi:uncharacterized protein LOC144430648 [Styela clava]